MQMENVFGIVRLTLSGKDKNMFPTNKNKQTVKLNSAAEAAHQSPLRITNEEVQYFIGRSVVNILDLSYG